MNVEQATARENFLEFVFQQLIHAGAAGLTTTVLMSR